MCAAAAGGAVLNGWRARDKGTGPVLGFAVVGAMVALVLAVAARGAVVRARRDK